jgi:hypothetical protein
MICIFYTFCDSNQTYNSPPRCSSLKLLHVRYCMDPQDVMDPQTPISPRLEFSATQGIHFFIMLFKCYYVTLFTLNFSIPLYDDSCQTLNHQGHLY